MELVVLLALCLIIGLVLKFVAYRGSEDVPLLLLLVSGVAGTNFVWWAFLDNGGHGSASLADWPHWTGALLAGALLELNVGSTCRRI